MAMDESCDSKHCVVVMEDGPICGCIEENEEGTFYQFKGIPYAKPPLGCLRFQPPSPIKPWTEILNCTERKPWPMYLDIPDKSVMGSEDCLYIEVSTPSVKPEKLMPVMLWVGCNGYVILSINKVLDPTFIIKENVVFVQCGFRIGPFGFLSINDFAAPGNNGLKDLIMAMKWIQRNIRAFGGDPNNVTLFGNNTGGAIVHLMTLSPMASGLFHKAIIQSTSSLNSWSLSKNPTPAVFELAEQLKITSKCKLEVIETLKTIPAIDIMNAYQNVMHKRCAHSGTEFFNTSFRPCIEQDMEGLPIFITKHPASIIKSGNYNKVPIIIGSNNVEALLLQFIKKDFYKDFEKFNDDNSLIVPKSLVGNVDLAKVIGQQLLKFYLGKDCTFREDTKNAFLQIITDYYFLYYVNKTARLHINSNPDSKVYYYVINYAGEWSLPPHLNFMNSLGHCAETPFIFGIKIGDKPICKGSRESVITRNRIVKMWTNFAKYGDPTPDEDDPLLQIKWDPIEREDKLNYLSIGSELTKGKNPFRERMAFWDRLHREHALLRIIVYISDLGVTYP